MFTVYTGKATGKTLDQQIAEYQAKLDQAKANIEICYDFVKAGRYELSPEWKEAILQHPRTKQEILGAEELIQEFYLTEDEEEFSPDEFQTVRWAIVMGLSSYLRKRTIELALQKSKAGELDQIIPLLSPEETARVFENTLIACYPNPNDFIVEYKQFREWHYHGDALERNTFSFWTDLLNQHSRVGGLLEYLQQKKEELKQTPFLERIDRLRGIETELSE